MRLSQLKRTHIIVFTSVLLLGFYILFEAAIMFFSPDQVHIAEIVESSLQQAEKEFREFEDDLVVNTLELTQQLQDRIRNSSAEKEIHQIAANQDFWSVEIYKNKQLWIWSGFSSLDTAFTADQNTAAETFMYKRNNITFLGCRTSFVLPDKMTNQTVNFSIITKRRLIQDNLLPFAENFEQEPAEAIGLDIPYEVNFTFFETLSEGNFAKEIIRINGSDSVGIATINLDNLDSIEKTYTQTVTFWRTIFIIAIAIYIICVFLVYTRHFHTFSLVLIRVTFISLIWFFAIYFDVSYVLIDALQLNFSVEDWNSLIRYGINAAFFGLLFVSLLPFLRNETDLILNSSPARVAFYFSSGFLFVSLFSIFVNETYSLIKSTDIQILDLEIYPSFKSILFYGVSFLFLSSIFLLFRWFFKENRSQANKPLIVISTLSGAILFMAIYFVFVSDYSHGIFISYFLGLLILLSPILYLRDKDSIVHITRPRAFLIFCSITTLVIHIISFQGFKDRQYKTMDELAESFSSESEISTREITDTILRNLEAEFNGITTQDLQERQVFIQNTLLEELTKILRPEWSDFSVDVQIITPQGEEIAQYSTNLDSPNWTRVFNLAFLEIPYVQEQVRKSTNRPILRSKPSAESASKYTEFQRGWIPVYQPDSAEQRIAWILCTVYKERPEYDKPIRAVLTALSEQNWQSTYYIYEFENGSISRSTVRGIPVRLPEFGRIPQEIGSKLSKEQPDFSTIRQINDQKIREYYTLNDSTKLIKVASSFPDLNNHIFSFFRFFFIILIPSIIFSWIAKAANLPLWSIFGHSRQFRQRLLDRFIYASIFCLIGLILITYHAISAQNEQLIRNELIKELDTLSEILTEDFLQAEANQSVASLEQLTSPLDVDATLYSPVEISESTTPQIYQQHLLPAIIPWDVLNDFTNQHQEQVTKKSMLGTQGLLIGYQPIYDREQQLAGILSIPTFLRSPKYNRQILSTTSLLLALYVVVFGIFIVGASLISRQLTQPLNSLQEGLKKISTGDLETTLPVESNDEIGALTRAYNDMVFKLKHLQKELALAEREAAWKEMAQQVAHEIKNPLTPMKLNLQHLERQMESTGKSLEALKPDISKITGNMIEQIESLSKIASDFARFAKPVQEDFIKLDLQKLICEVEELFSHSDRVEIYFKKDSSPLFVLGVKSDLKRVLINLIKNATEAISEEGKISIKTYSTADLVFVEIEDNGTGITIADQQKIFVPNFSTKSSGTGLGLAISKKIIEAHGGEISFSTVEEKGTVFKINLPKVSTLPTN